MSNPLKSMMGNTPPLAPNIQGAMNMLAQSNPQAAQQVQQLMQSGQNPQAIIQQMTSQMNPQQKMMLNQLASKFGLR